MEEDEDVGKLLEISLAIMQFEDINRLRRVIEMATARMVALSSNGAAAHADEHNNSRSGS